MPGSQPATQARSSSDAAASTMLGVVYRGRKDVRVERVPKPRIETSNDALVRVTAAGICGSDLHLYHYSVPEPIGGTIVLGREQVLLTP